MILGVFWAFAFLVVVPAAPMNRFQILPQLTDSLPDSLMLNDYLLPGLKSITSSRYTSPIAYFNNEPSPVLPIDYFSQLNIHPPPKSAHSLNGAEAGQSNLKPMTIPQGFDLEAFNTAQTDSPETLECSEDKTKCSYCNPSSGCVVYTVKCEESDPGSCSLCRAMAGVVAPVCMPFDDHIKGLPPPKDSSFDFCKTQQCSPT